MAAPGQVAVHCQTGRVEAVPVGKAWLLATERDVKAGLRVSKRRNDWRLGRWLAKNASLACVEGSGSLADVEVIAGADGAPSATLYVGDVSIPISLSISHSEGWGFAIASRSAVRLGCDVEAIRQRTSGFVADYFTPAERKTVNNVRDDQRDATVNLIWSAKESMLKLLREGLRYDTRSVEVSVSPTAAPTGAESTGGQLAVRFMGGDQLLCHWWIKAGMVWTVVGSGPLNIQL